MFKEVSMGKSSKDREPAERGRWTSQKKVEAVMRLLKGEDLDSLSRELGISGARLSEWRDEFLAAGKSGLKSRKPDPREEQIRWLKDKLADVTMDYEVLAIRFQQLGMEVPRPRTGRSSS